MPDADPRQLSPAADRNKQAILEQLLRLLPPRGTALEVASGTGQHVAHFGASLTGWTWLPSDPEPAALASIAAWTAGLANVRPPLQLDVRAASWPVPGGLDAIYCANMLHISPWATCAALMRGAAQHLAPHGLLLTYGPYLVDSVVTAASNLAFDADLRERDPAWGLRRLEDVATEAARAGLQLREWIAMPANNLLVIFSGPQGAPPAARAARPAWP